MREIPPDTVQRGLSRERLVGAALELIQDEGLEGLSMRALAERLSVKAASLYWHVRDRGELLELLAESILDSVARPRPAAGWRASALAIGAALRDRIREQKDAGRILPEAPDALRQSHTFADLRSRLTSAGLPAAEAGDVAMMAMTYVIAGGSAPVEIAPDARGGEPAEPAIDSGSRRVVVRVRLDDFSSRATVIDTHWESDGASASADRFELTISGGAVNIALDSYELKAPVTASPAEAPRSGASVSALDILLDGVEARIARP